MFTDFLLLALITVIAVSAILNELIYYDKQLIITFGLVNIVKKSTEVLNSLAASWEFWFLFKDLNWIKYDNKRIGQ